MGAETGISWTDSTFNPWIGCQRVSPGCERCYAETQDSRKRWEGRTHWGPLAPRYRTSESTWRNPLAWNRKAQAAGVRARVFCASLADVFEDRPELVPWRAQLFEMILQTPWLDWQLLTKRPQNIRRLWPLGLNGPSPLFWPNVWLGTTVEDQRRAEERIPQLLAVPAAVRFLSCEPLLEAVDLTRVRDDEAGARWNVLEMGIDWVIIGGESGPGARRFDLAWARSLVKQCSTAGVATFVKQLGARPFGLFADGESFTPNPGANADPDFWPADLCRVRDFPRSARAA